MLSFFFFFSFISIQLFLIPFPSRVSSQKIDRSMDWGNVTTEDLIVALREVDWSSPPRPLSEFFSRFTIPRSYAKWNNHLKCNLYYYRTNYFLMIILILGLGFLMRPIAIFAAALTAISIAFLNDRPVIRGRPSAKRAIHICGRPRWVFVVEKL